MSRTRNLQITAKDFSVIEAVLDDLRGDDKLFAPLLRRKLEEAEIVFGDDIAPNVATLDSRVVFRVNDSPAYTRTLVADRRGGAARAALPITSFRGIALLGLVAGETVTVDPTVGQPETILLEAVAFQPEAAARAQTDGPALAAPIAANATTNSGKVLAFTGRARPTGFRPVLVRDPEDDDPGPSAA